MITNIDDNVGATRKLLADLGIEKNTEQSGTQTFNEGCLSFPGVSEEIKRADHVHVRAQDMSGKYFELSTDGLLAVAIQHENDHLNGVLMIDKLSALKKRRMGRKLAKRAAP